MRLGGSSEAVCPRERCGVRASGTGGNIIIDDGILLICELKFSFDKAGMYVFECKVRFYETHHQCKTDRLTVDSPMIDPWDMKATETLQIEAFRPHGSLNWKPSALGPMFQVDPKRIMN